MDSPQVSQSQGSAGLKVSVHDSKAAKAQFLAIVGPYLGDALGLARWITGSKDDAEDVVQEASIRALRGIDKFANGNARAWLLTIVRNTAYDWLRKNRSGAIVFMNDYPEGDSASFSEPEPMTCETALMKMQEASWLESAMLTLPPHYRETLVLREVQDLSYAEIAVLTGVSIGTTMSRLFRARRQLAAQLKSADRRGRQALTSKTPVETTIRL